VRTPLRRQYGARAAANRAGARVFQHWLLRGTTRVPNVEAPCSMDCVPLPVLFLFDHVLHSRRQYRLQLLSYAVPA
jgi:hypothetical protein